MARPWRQRLAPVLALGLVLCVALVASAFGVDKPDARTSCPLSSGGCPSLQSLQVVIDAAVRPQALPKHQMAPVALEFQSKVSTSNGTHPSALREMVIDLDRDIALDSRGLPVCHFGRRDIRRSLAQIGKICDDAVVGRGHAVFEIELSEGPIRIASKVIVFSVGATGGQAPKLIAAAEVDVPAPTIVATAIEVSRAHIGDFGLRAVVKVPVVAGGSGSLLGFKLRLRRLFDRSGSRESLVAARCADGSFNIGFPKLLFRNEAHTPGVASTTLIRGGIEVPCSRLL